MYASVNDTNTCSSHITKSQMFFFLVWCLMFDLGSTFSSMAFIRSLNMHLTLYTVQSGTQKKSSKILQNTKYILNSSHLDAVTLIKVADFI